MKRLIALVIVLLLGFYVAWPGWSGYQIASALKAKDAPTLERKISFEDVRVSLKPTVLQKINEFYDKSQSSPLGASIAGNISKDVGPAIADAALLKLVTAPNLIRIVHEGSSLKDGAEKILREQISQIGLPGIGGIPGVGGAGGGGGGGGIKLPGGLGGFAEKMGIDPGKISGIPGMGAPKAAEPAPAPAAGGAGPAPASYGLSNIKKFSFHGPLAFEVGVAKDSAAAESDVVVEMRFVGGDWRVVGVRPRV